MRLVTLARVQQPANVPQLLGGATLDERRAVLEQVLDVIYLMPHQAMAVRPVESYAPLLQAARLKIMGEWAGWVSGRNCKHTQKRQHKACDSLLLCSGKLSRAS